MEKIFVGIGSNKGDRRKNIWKAFNLISKLPKTQLVNISALYETSPIGPKQRNFYNACCELHTELAPEKLLTLFKKIEKKLGRRVNTTWKPRKIDLDIIFYGQKIINHPKIKIPHPEIQNRKFVLYPLNDIASDFLHPVLKKTVKELLKKLKSPSQKIKRIKWLK